MLNFRKFTKAPKKYCVDFFVEWADLAQDTIYLMALFKSDNRLWMT